MKTLMTQPSVFAVLAVAIALAPDTRSLADAQEPRKGEPVAAQKEKIMVWVEKFFDNHDCPLETEMIINGKSVGKFQSSTQKDIGDLIKPGRNTFVFTTTPEDPATSKNELAFRIGSVTTNPKTKKTTMGPVLMVVINSTDWKLNEDNGKYTHPFGPNPKTPNKKSVTLTYEFDYAGVVADRTEVKEGDYVLQSDSFFEANPSFVSTLTMNGKSLGSFHAGHRSLVVTDLLKPGENEIRLATAAVANQLHGNEVSFEIIGPMTYSTAKQKFLGKQVVQFKDAEGYTRDKDSGVMHLKGKPGVTSHERVIRFSLEAK